METENIAGLSRLPLMSQRVEDWFPCKHLLQVDPNLNVFSYLLVMTCRNCDWVIVFYKHQLRSIVTGVTPYMPSVIYRAWKGTLNLDDFPGPQRALRNQLSSDQ